MKTRRHRIIAAITVLTVLASPWLASVSAKVLNDNQLRKLAQWDYAKDGKLLVEVEETLRQVTDSEKEEFEAQLISILESDNATTEGKFFTCRILRRCATEMSVPALAKLLPDQNLSHMARFVLERLHSPKATEALRQALSIVDPKLKIGIVNSLGQRRDNASVDQIKPFLASPDLDMARAAINAMGRIGTLESAKALGLARVPRQLRNIKADAYLLCADSMLKENNEEIAARIYEQMTAETNPMTIRIAGYRGMVKINATDKAQLVIAMLKAKEDELRETGGTFVREIKDTRTLKKIASECDGLPPKTLVVLIGALEDTGNIAITPELVKLLDHSQSAVRSAAIKALGTLGDQTVIPALLSKAVDTDDEAKTALDSLIRISGDTVSDMMIDLADKTKDAAEKAALLSVLVERKANKMVPLALKALQDVDSKVRRQALSALTAMGQLADIPAIIEQLEKSDTSGEKRLIERLLVQLTNRLVAEGIDKETLSNAFSKLYNNVEKANQAYIAPVFAAIGDKLSYETVKPLLKSEFQKIAITVFSQWPNALPLDDLKELTKATDDNTIAVLAYRGYVRLIALSGKSPEEMVKLYKEAISIAPSANEKKVVMSEISKLPLLQALQLAITSSKDKQIKEEAEFAAIQIAKLISASYPDEVIDILSQLKDASSNDTIKKQAQDVLDSVGRFNGFIVSWQVSGPYVKENADGRALFDQAFPPEQADASNYSWKIFPAGTNQDRPWLLEIDKALGNAQNRVAYLRTMIYSDADQKATLEMGSDDGLKVWIDGKLVHANNAVRPCNPGEDKAEITLKKGKNIMLVKITQGGGQWQACLKIVDKNGQPLNGVRARLVD